MVQLYTQDSVYALLHGDTEALLLLVVANATLYAGGAALGASRRTSELDIHTVATPACSANGPWSACETVRRPAALLLQSLAASESVPLMTWTCSRRQHPRLLCQRPSGSQTSFW